MPWSHGKSFKAVCSATLMRCEAELGRYLDAMRASLFVRGAFTPVVELLGIAGAAVGSRLAILKGSEFVRRFFLGVVLLLITRFAYELAFQR